MVQYCSAFSTQILIGMKCSPHHLQLRQQSDNVPVSTGTCTESDRQDLKLAMCKILGSKQGPYTKIYADVFSNTRHHV